MANFANKKGGTLTDNTSIVMDTKEVAQLLKVKPQTIYSWIYYKQIPDKIYRKLGRRPRFIYDEVMKWFFDGAKITKRKSASKEN